MAYQPPPTFNRKVVQPIECIKDGYAAIKDQYWLFVGVALVAILIAGAVPFVLVGPMMCGLFLTLFKKLRGETVEFGTVFQGFDFFGPSFVATILHVIPIIIILVPFYLFLFVGPMLMVATAQGNEPSPAMPIIFMLVMIFFMVVFALLMIVVNVAFTFAYPLVAGRRLGGLDAVKLSARASLANFWGILGLMLICGLMGFVGVLLCYVGVFLVLPINFAAIAMAYSRVFGLYGGEPAAPPPPPVFS